MRNILILLAILLVGGCLSKSGADVDASSSNRGSRDAKGNDEKERKPRQICENTLIGGEAKTVCY